MQKSITETLKKINTELSGSAFLSILLTFISLNLFLGYKIVSSEYFLDKNELQYQNSSFSESQDTNINKHFIYASKRGTKYYYWNCKASIKEANKIYFETDASAQKAGYTLSKTCK